MKRLLTCPHHGTLATIEYDRDPSDGHIIGVRRCSLAAKEDWVECDRLCAKLLNEKMQNLTRRKDD